MYDPLAAGEDVAAAAPPAPPAPTLAVGVRVEALFNQTWYPAAVTHADAANDLYTVIYIGYGNVATVDYASTRPLAAAEPPVAPEAAVAGFECQARYSGDGRYYDATVETVTSHGYRVKFPGYGTTEEVPLEYLRARTRVARKPAAGGVAGAAADARDANGEFKVPENLKILPTDSEEEIARKRKKIKAIKSKNRSQAIEDERNSKASNWQAFQKKAATKKAPKGSMVASGLKRGSMFAAPTSVDGRVGVVGSGGGMTEFTERKKYQRSS